MFNDKISTPILNSGGDHLTGSSVGINILTDSFIAENYLSPNGLVKALSEEFCEGGKQVRSSSDLVKEKYGEDKAYEIVEKICKDHSEFVNEKLAEVAVHSILEKAAPDLLKSKYLSEFKKDVEELLKPSAEVEVESLLRLRDGDKENLGAMKGR
ncbi:MAG: hypothetical protein KGQ36_04145 [Rickettsiales bacterium]|nr:hypothetical protein [Rickettsiales bacterium]